MAIRESGDGFSDGGVDGGRPGGVTDASPETVVRAEREQLGGGAGDGGQRRAVEAVEDVRSDDIRMYGGAYAIHDQS